MTQQELKQPYSRQNWQNWLGDIFGNQLQVETQTENIDIDRDNIKSIKRFASIKIVGGKNLAVLDIETRAGVQIARNRVGLRDLVIKFIDHANYHGILAFYHSEDVAQNSYRLSFISSEPTIDADGNFIVESTAPKRFTYILGEHEKTKTPADRLKIITDKRGNVTMEDIKSAFSVETLTKEFYKELFQWYQWTLSEEVGITFPRNTATAVDDREKLEEQIIRLITRLLFVWFIKQKHLVTNNLFDKNELKIILKDFEPTDSRNGNYYNAILQNLFFATLNKAVSERAFAKEENSRDIKTLYRYAEMFTIEEQQVLELFKPIPFLNGGLFECLDKEISTDGIKYHLDGFSRNDQKANGQYSHRAFIPNCIFFDEEKGIIPLLERYNFTVEENAPGDVHVALDPELLGNVFENLLGAFNNETKESARKQSGSFYTPREIVDFMVSESLHCYLQQHLGDFNISKDLPKDTKQKFTRRCLTLKFLILPVVRALFRWVF